MERIGGATLFFVITLCACSAITTAPGSGTASPGASPAPVALSTEPPLLVAGGLRLRVGASDLRAEDATTGQLRWSLERVPLPGADTMRWRVLGSRDGSFVYAQLVADRGSSPSYLGTRRIDARTGAELASDVKDEIWWFENVVLWTALDPAGRLVMAVERAARAGGGYRLRTLDPLTLAIRTDDPLTVPPSPPGR